MKAKEARILYAEKYITFENEIRKLSKRTIDLYITKNKSLNKMIMDLSKVNQYKKPNIKIKLLIKQKNVRNWLFHMNSNSTVPDHYLKLMNEIDDLLELIKSW